MPLRLRFGPSGRLAGAEEELEWGQRIMLLADESVCGCRAVAGRAGWAFSLSYSHYHFRILQTKACRFKLRIKQSSSDHHNPLV